MRIYVARANGGIIAHGGSDWFRRTRPTEIFPEYRIVIPPDTDRIRGLRLWQSVATHMHELAVALLAVRWTMHKIR